LSARSIAIRTTAIIRSSIQRSDKASADKRPLIEWILGQVPAPVYQLSLEVTTQNGGAYPDWSVD
jgi:hypothetical protein